MAQTMRADSLGGGALPDKRWVGRSFGKAASGYDRVAALQREVGGQLLARLWELPQTPGAVLDVGAGTGYCTGRLAEKFPDADLIALDIALGMLRVLPERTELRGRALRICGDAEALPLRAGSMDRVFSNLALQWCGDLPAALAEFRRVLKPGGSVLFSTFGEGTLSELRAAWAQVDGYSHVNAFASQAAVAAALADAGLGDVRLIGERRVLSYQGVEGLLRELKGLGARNITQGRPRHLTGKGAFRKLLDAYPKLPDGRIAASFEILYGVACWAG